MRRYTTNRNFEQELFTEIKYHNHCKKIDKDPKHFCTQSELAKNLKMSARDVGPNLHNLVEQGKLTHEKIIVKGILRDKFTPIDKRLFDNEKLIQMMTDRIEERFKALRELAKKMKKTPALYNIKIVEHGTTGKINKKGMEYLNQFCDTVKDILSFVDSMNYAMFRDGNGLSRDRENMKAIDDIRNHTINEIEKILEFIFEGLDVYHSYLLSEENEDDLKKKVILDQIVMKIPTYYMLVQIQKQAMRKVE